MKSEINRRDFVRLLSAGGVGVSCLPLTEASAAKTVYGRGAAEPDLNSTTAVSARPYYRFAEQGNECIIQRPDTPAPWMNLLANDTFLTWITQRGYIECALLDRSHNGLTNPQETSGLIYVRDRKSGEYFCVNSPGSGVEWQCRHGLGYTTIRASALDGLTVEVTYFVPRKDNLVVWLINGQRAGTCKS